MRKKQQPTGPFRVGDVVQLTGPKGRLNTITLVAGAAFGTHRGDLKHDEIIGKPEGSIVQNQFGVEYLALRPLMTDFVLSMPRGAAIIYPERFGPDSRAGRHFPGCKRRRGGRGFWSFEHVPTARPRRTRHPELFRAP